MSDNHFIAVNTPLLDGNEKKYLIECIDTGWISSEGPFIKEFEEKFAAKICLTGNEEHSETVLRSGRVLGRSLYHAQRNRL